MGIDSIAALFELQGVQDEGVTSDAVVNSLDPLISGPPVTCARPFLLGAGGDVKGKFSTAETDSNSRLGSPADTCEDPLTVLFMVKLKICPESGLPLFRLFNRKEHSNRNSDQLSSKCKGSLV